MFKDKMHIPFGVNLLILKYFMYYIQTNSEAENKKFKYLLTLSCFIKLCAYLLSGGTTMLHFYFVKKENLDIGISEDLSLLLTSAGIAYIAISYAVYSKDWSKIIQSLTDYRKFGKPPKTDETIKFWNRIMLMLMIYFLFMVIAYEIATLYEGTACDKEAERKNLHINCWTMFPLLLPVEITVSTQLIISFLQLIFVSYLATPLGSAILLPWEISQLLALHVDHLNNMFNNIVDTDSKEDQRRRLNKWIACHVHIIRNIDRLNRVTKRCIGIISLVVSLVCALTANEIINRVKPLATCLHLFGWLGSLAIHCLTGQQIIDKTESITTNIVCSEWYKADIRIQKDIIIILANTQRSFVLGALPLGTLDMALFLLIIKSSYSYLTIVTNIT